jgi:hypothetical protein
MKNKVMFDYGQKKFVNLEAEDDIADKYEKKYPDYVHEPALYDYGMKGFFGTKTNKRYSTPEATLQNDRYNSIMKVENLVQNTKPVEEILDYKMKNKSLKGIFRKPLAETQLELFDLPKYDKQQGTFVKGDKKGPLSDFKKPLAPIRDDFKLLESAADTPYEKAQFRKIRREAKQREASRQKEMQTQFEKDHPFENALVNVVKGKEERPFGQDAVKIYEAAEKKPAAAAPAVDNEYLEMRKEVFKTKSKPEEPLDVYIKRVAAEKMQKEEDKFRKEVGDTGLARLAGQEKGYFIDD